MSTRIAVLLLALLYCFSPSIHAIEIEGYPFVLEADVVEYEEDTKDIYASGNVYMTHLGYELHADFFTYTAASRRIYYEGNVVIIKDNKRLSADSFEYEFDSQSGSAENLHAVVDGTIIRGRQLQLTASTSNIIEASFTTCDIPDHPHYLVTSDKVSLYPDSGDILAKGNVLRFQGVPLLIFPTFIYNTRTINQGSSSIPEFGHNPVDGTFAKFHSAYFLNPRSTGTFTLGTSSFRGFMFGARHRFTMSPDHRLILKAYSVNKTGLEGGIIYEQDLFTKKQDPTEKRLFAQLFSPFSADQEKSHTFFTIQMLHNEIVNFTLVDYLPLVAVETHDLSMPLGTNLTVITNGGYLSDMQHTGFRTQVSPQLSKEFPISHNLDLDTSLTYIGNSYPGNGRWDRSLGRVSLSFYLPAIQPTVSYTKLFHNAGKSPFIFDATNTVEGDEIGFKVTTYPFDMLFSIEADYEIPRKRFRNFIYTIGIKQHCWQFTVGINTVFQDFRIGFSLLDPKDPYQLQRDDRR